ncbi:fructose 1,6-bisphosphatase [Bosea sp. F3-2]|uniref:fructose-1,6-bisphosphatase n=1 Tax=Bosea sp. F3-2 TaxID=2599640 RepID=UPI0011EF8BB2|nr:fructose 1,6-bisphosphatase [Bosea sp. F3-2]QEL22210.1 fructose 1,6-bisphosphatase [Bosea sp. F3-2]
MRLTVSVIKADVGSVGGHTKPSPRMLDSVRGEVSQAIESGLLIDGFVCHTGDDIAILMTHLRGSGSRDVHQFAWNTFLAATAIAKTSGLYGAGQDLLVDAPSGNVRGAGPAVAELTFEHSLSGVRPAESFMVFAADKCGPGAYNLPLYLAFADPMYCAGLMLPPMIKGFRFHIIDMDNTAGDSVIELDAPEDSYRIAALLRDNERFGIDRIVSRTHGEPAAAVSAQRLHSIAGKYTGKDDPVAILRNQGIFPAPEEVISPFAKAHFVGGDARGSHVMPLMPVPLNTPVTGLYCLPIVSCIGFSIDKQGRFSEAYTDFFDNLAWDEVRRRAQSKAIEMRSQGWSGAAMLPYSELEYGGFRDTVGELVERFKIRDEREPAAAE